MNSCLIRCEYSSEIGFGHLMRCLVLAAEFNKLGYRVYMLSGSGRPDISNSDLLAAISHWYITDEQLGTAADAVNLISVAKSIGAPLVLLDFYGVSDTYQMQILNGGLKWLQFDGLANQPLWSDWVLSISPSASEDIYSSLRQRPETVFLLGPKYAILRHEFRKNNNGARIFGEVKQVLLAFGGGDDLGMTLFCLKAIKRLEWCGKVYVVAGKANPNISAISTWIYQNGDGNVELSVDEADMAKVMRESDMAVISGGMTTFEIARMGLPSIIIRIADNQRANALAWDRMGVARDIGEASLLTKEVFSLSFMEMVNNVGLRKRMSQQGVMAVDGQGAERVVRYIAASGSGT